MNISIYIYRYISISLQALWLNYFIAQVGFYLLFGYLPEHKSFKLLSLSGRNVCPRLCLLSYDCGYLFGSSRVDSTGWKAFNQATPTGICAYLRKQTKQGDCLLSIRRIQLFFFERARIVAGQKLFFFYLSWLVVGVNPRLQLTSGSCKPAAVKLSQCLPFTSCPLLPLSLSLPSLIGLSATHVAHLCSGITNS